MAAMLMMLNEVVIQTASFGLWKHRGNSNSVGSSGLEQLSANQISLVLAPLIEPECFATWHRSEAQS